MGAASSGAQNANSFHAAVRVGGAGGLPTPDSLTYQGIFNEHSFKVGEPEQAALLAVAAQVARQPTGGAEEEEEEVWIGCFLKSCRDGVPRDTTPIDVVAVLDVSGSMGATVGSEQTRLQLATEALKVLLPRLRSDDRFGLATFTTEGTVVQSLASVGEINQQDLSSRISTLRPGGGTTIAAGMEAAVKICESASDPSGSRHRRLLFLTDMEDISGDLLDAMIEEQASHGLYTSFVGVGMGFNATLAERVTKHRGSNYFCITRPQEMQQVIVDEFDWNFFPAAFDVEVSLQSETLDFVEVFGTPFDSREEALQAEWLPSTHKFYPADFKRQARELLLCATRHGARLPLVTVQTVLGYLSPSTATVVRVDTVFPSAVEEDGSIRGGLVLLRLRPRGGSGGSGAARLLLRYTTGAGAGEAEVSSCLDLQTPGTVAAGAPEPALARGRALQRYVSVCRGYIAAANEEGAREEELQEACRKIEKLRTELELMPETEAETLCPGLRGDLQRFEGVARGHLKRFEEAEESRRLQAQ